MTKLEQILEKASDTKALVTGSGVLARVPEMFRNLFPGKRPIIIADPRTFAIAGERLQQMFVADGLNPDSPYILTAPDLHAEWCFVEELDKALAATDAVAVAVGSGTVNDLCKLASEHNGRRYMTVGTAASMDGYTAFGASITKDGAKQTFSCRAPLGFVADIDIIAAAPPQMTASGYADLFAKVPAGADWILADALGVEPIDHEAFDTVQGGLKEALANPEGCRNGDKESIGRLIDGLLYGGFAMQIHKSSRPASGADHQFSHLWNMEHHVMADGTMPSHGFQVSIGTLMSTALYEQFLAEDIAGLDIEACVAAWPALGDALAEAEDMFRATDFPSIGEKELAAKYIDGEALRRQLTLLRDNWPEIRERLKAQIVPVEELRRRLKAVGAPVEPEEIGISRERLCRSAYRAYFIRRRFTILDIAVRTRNLDKWLGRIFE